MAGGWHWSCGSHWLCDCTDPCTREVTWGTLTSFPAPARITWRCRHADSQVSTAGHGATQGWSCSHMSSSCTRAAAVLSVKMRGNRWHIPVTVPSLREAAIHILGLMQVVRAEIPLAAFTPALGVQHNFSSKSFLIQAGIWCLQTSATAKSSVLSSECRVSASRGCRAPLAFIQVRKEIIKGTMKNNPNPLAVFSSFFSLFSVAEPHQTDACLPEIPRWVPGAGTLRGSGGESLLCELRPPRAKKRHKMSKIMR